MKRLLAAEVLAADSTPRAALTIAVFGDNNLRLTIDPSRNVPFTWVNVPYCSDPNESCQ